MFFTPYDCGGLLGPLVVLSFKFRTFLARALVVRTFLEAPKAFLAITNKQSPLDYPKTTDPKISRRDKDQQKTVKQLRPEPVPKRIEPRPGTRDDLRRRFDLGTRTGETSWKQKRKKIQLSLVL